VTGQEADATVAEAWSDRSSLGGEHADRDKNTALPFCDADYYRDAQIFNRVTDASLSLY
jgi:hypothetical protein